MTTWIISDTHFGDASLVGAPTAAGKVARPFETVSQMDDCLADLWNDHIVITMPCGLPTLKYFQM